MRFLLSTGWLIGAGGGWALALAGLSAGARGVNPVVDLIIVGGAASWVGMLWTALRPGKSPNLLQVVLAGASWLMPITMLILREEFSTNFILLAFASATCVTLIVVVYPSQSYAPAPVSDRRLEMHMVQALKDERLGSAEQGIQRGGEPDRSTRGEAETANLAASVLAGAGLMPTREPAVGAVSVLPDESEAGSGVSDEENSTINERREKLVAQLQEDPGPVAEKSQRNPEVLQQAAVETVTAHKRSATPSRFVVPPTPERPASRAPSTSSKWIAPSRERKGTLGTRSSEAGSRKGDRS